MKKENERKNNDDDVDDDKCNIKMLAIMKIKLMMIIISCKVDYFTVDMGPIKVIPLLYFSYQKFFFFLLFLNSFFFFIQKCSKPSVCCPKPGSRFINTKSIVLFVEDLASHQRILDGNFTDEELSTHVNYDKDRTLGDIERDVNQLGTERRSKVSTGEEEEEEREKMESQGGKEEEEEEKKICPKHIHVVKDVSVCVLFCLFVYFMF